MYAEVVLGLGALCHAAARLPKNERTVTRCWVWALCRMLCVMQPLACRSTCFKEASRRAAASICRLAARSSSRSASSCACRPAERGRRASSPPLHSSYEEDGCR